MLGSAWVISKIKCFNNILQVVLLSCNLTRPFQILPKIFCLHCTHHIKRFLKDYFLILLLLSTWNCSLECISSSHDDNVVNIFPRSFKPSYYIIWVRQIGFKRCLNNLATKSLWIMCGMKIEPSVIMKNPNTIYTIQLAFFSKYTTFFSKFSAAL